MFDKSFPHFLPKLSRKTSTNFLGPNILNCTYQRLVNFDIVLLCLQFPPKNEQKQVDLRYHSSKVEFVCSCFGGIKDTIICFRDYLTFSLLEFKKYIALVD